MKKIENILSRVLLAAVLAAAAPAGAADLSVVYSFNPAGAVNLYRPEAGVAIDAAGDLFGTTIYAGPVTNVSGGGVYELARQSDGSYAASTVATFAVLGTGPHNPAYDPVTLDAAGNIYGATVAGGANAVGEVYKIAAGSTTVTTLASFTASSVNTGPRGALALTADGTLWGTDQTGYAGTSSSFGSGSIFKVTTNSSGQSTATTVASFGANGLAGALPFSGLIADGHGDLYGSTQYTGGNLDGMTGYGTLFKVDTSTGIVTTLATFTGGAGGSIPYLSLAVDAAGDLFGTTTSGGANSYGTVFELAAGASNITTLASFNALTNGYMARGLIIDAAGDLFGVTGMGNLGGAAPGGAVWELATGSGTITTLASFASTGTGPRGSYGGLVADAQGNLYGTSGSGGAYGYGTVFELTNTGFVTTAVPEPATWATMIAGMGAIGFAMRRRNLATRGAYAA